ncbi:brachyurin-like [Leguminivora glycinivorella]|uniref:brachyurin-like n=1 Tax=Leguminivora glycinivorella TaxID=1035111 RepID=UPI002010AD5E|nr:brachyurin-like [Leguminivora glycinivorella]
MRVLLFGLAVLATAAASVLPTAEPVLGYHDAVGIPHAAKIKALEDEYFASLDEESPAEPRIVGGVVSGTGAHPYLAGLVISFINIAGQSACGASLLSANRLITAAHCWNDGTKQAWQFEVVLGSNWLFSGGTRISTTQVIMHPSWSPSTLANDVAMIYLPTNVAFSTVIQPVALPSTTQLWDQFVGMWSTASGYGKTSDLQAGVSTASVVSQVSLQVISMAQCQISFGHWILDSTLCTNGIGGVGICSGDSGGPLVINSNGQNILVGISSFVASSGCQLGHPSAFARVTSFYSFIVSHL